MATFILMITPAWAGSSDPGDLSSGVSPVIDRDTQELDLDLLGKVYFLTEQYRFNMANYIPLSGLPQNDDGNVVAQKILKFSLQNFLDSYKDGSNLTLREVANINHNMKAAVGSENHSLQFRLRLVEGTAEATYKGSLPIQSKLVYEAYNRELHFEVSRKWGEKTYAITHVNDPEQSTDVVGVRWGW